MSESYSNSKLINILKSFLDFLRRVAIKTAKDRVPAQASALAFTTLLALVPFIALLFSIAKLNSIITPLKSFVISILIPTDQTEIVTAISRFSENSGSLGFWGLILFIIIVVLLINKIELYFNHILHSRPNRNIFIRLGIYTVSIIVGVVGIGASFTLADSFMKTFQFRAAPEGMWQTLLSLFYSYSFIFLMLFLLIFTLTSARVKIKSALVGSICGAFFWEVARRVFALWASISVRNSVVYGSLFIIPILLIWLHVAWIVILTSVQITAIHQFRDLNFASVIERESPGDLVLATLEVYLLVAKRYFQNQAAPKLIEMSIELSITEKRCGLILSQLDNQGLITNNGKILNRGYLPSKALDKITFNDVLNKILGNESIEEKSEKEARTVLNIYREKLPAREMTLESYFKIGLQ